jgi:uncharacterized coiled-coil protein SlyX
MVDASFSRQKHREDLAAAAARRRLLVPIVAGFLFISAGVSLVWAFGGTAPVPPARDQVSSELLETTKGLQSTQQQAVDQLQVVQDQLVAQNAETRRLSEQIATVTGKLEALQQSVADIPAPSPGSPPKSHR